MDSKTPRKSFTGQTRERTKAHVRWADRAARWIIAGGGIGTILVVFLVCIYLVWQVVPLFKPTRVETAAAYSTPWRQGSIIRTGTDEFRLLGWGMFSDGRVVQFRLSDGRQIGKAESIQSTAGKNSPAVTAWAFDVDGQHFAVGFADGSVRLGKIGFKTTFLEPEKVPDSVRQIEIGASAELNGGIAVHTPKRQFRLQKLAVEFESTVEPASKQPVAQIALAVRNDGPIYCARSADGAINVRTAQKRHNMLTDEDVLTFKKAKLPAMAAADRSPDYLVLSGLGDSLILAWKKGRLIRFDIRDPNHAREVERTKLLSEPDRKLTALEYMLGGATLVAGDSAGEVRTWSVAKSKQAHTPDHAMLVNMQTFAPCGSAISAIGPSTRTRAVAAATADGRVRLFYATGGRELGEVRLDDRSPVSAVAFTPRADGLIAAGSAGFGVWNVDLGYPEITLATLFRPVWYEGFDAPTHSWQTSSGNDAFESKFGLVPLIFGTLKATFYSMLFGAPLALLAAIYTSEFLRPSLRAKIKPAVETMASLPSVVLGFLGGLVIAPLMENVVPGVLAAFVAVPFCLLLTAHLWQLLPVNLAVRWARWRFAGTFVVVPLGVALAAAVGPYLERELFGGDVKAWLNQRPGPAEPGWFANWLFPNSAAPGWFFALLPLSALVTWTLVSRMVNPVLRERAADWSRLRSGLAELAKFLVATLFCLVLACGVARLLTSGVLSYLTAIVDPRLGQALGDPRGWIVDNYIQRNAMIVGFMMGFAIIPLIYTIADDALSSVPAHLRSASLGAGATHWLSSVGIFVPTLMCGLFSALMIGLGRAVGETMIVLMAAGNTPITEFNPFNGFQTLSAAIATEMSEAPAGGTLFRTLFLAALTLFAITFVGNSAAEMVRIRFRRRAYEPPIHSRRRCRRIAQN